MRLFFAALCFAARVTSEDPEAAAQAVEALLESTEEALPDSTTINAGDAVRTDAHGTEALSEAEIAVWSGLDAAVEEAAFALIPDDPLVDHDWLDVVRADNNMSALEQRCQRAIKRAAWQEARALPPFLYTDALDGVSVGDRDDPGDPRIVYFIGASRDTAAIMVSRLVLALYHTSHLFLIHVDLKAAPTVHEQLAELIKSHPNVHLMQTRRLVQWAGWTMVATMLDALKSINERNMDCKPRARHGPPLPARTRHAAQFAPIMHGVTCRGAASARTADDFFINLSDVDISLRTDREIVGWLKRFKGRNFVQANDRHVGGEWIDRARNFTRDHAVVECGG